ncbi:hypothetical protein OROHE_009077 [Orobanche hederae]
MESYGREPDPDEVEILMQVIKSGNNPEGTNYSYSEFYTVNLIKGLVRKCPTGRLIFGDRVTSMAVIGHVIYILGGYEYMEKNRDGCFSIGGGTGTAHFHRKASCIDLINNAENGGWKPIPPYPSEISRPTCLSFKGRLFIFGGNINDIESHGEVFDPKKGKWDLLPTPPDSKLTRNGNFGTHVSRPVVVDHAKNRIIVHFRHFVSLCAYYPDECKWENLLPPGERFWGWSHLVAFFDVERTPSREDALFTLMSFNNHDIDSKCYVTNFVPKALSHVHCQSKFIGHQHWVVLFRDVLRCPSEIREIHRKSAADPGKIIFLGS